ncbi:MAG: putative toxin-antitoxin system toxin component, PIN family [Bacteroidales bacterium]|nr:putative toxin-antitoxin system toxin component, PIN family [Bacteroidales bacterium]
MKVILDCNIWISFLLSKQNGLLKRILTDMRFDVCVCKELINEIKNVSSRQKIRKYVNDNDVNTLLEIINAFCQYGSITSQAESNIRDKKDLYLLSFAESIDAIYIVSGDKDLTELRQHNNTKIITLAEFRQQMMLF